MPDQYAAAFMERVVPWPAPGTDGVINLHWFAQFTGKDGKPAKALTGRPFTTPTRFWKCAEWCNTHPHRAHDVYFCLSQQSRINVSLDGKRVKAKRAAAYAAFLKSVWLDLDVKQGAYADTIAAIDHLGAFCLGYNLPEPAIVRSGSGGVHVYWISNRPLTPDEWLIWAQRLHTAAKAFGLHFDGQCTINAAQLLRVPGTFNFKRSPPAQVTLVHLPDQDYDFAADLAGLPTTVTVPVTAGAAPRTFIDPKIFPRKPITAPIPRLVEDDFDARPVHPEAVIRGCPMFANALLTGGKDQPQGVWMNMVLACTFMEQGEILAEELTSGYIDKHGQPSDPGVRKAMWDLSVQKKDAGMRWPGCKAFEGQGCKECAACPHRGKIKSPLNLQEPEPVVSPQFAVPPASVKDLHLPDKFDVIPTKYGPRIAYFEPKTKKDDDGTEIPDGTEPPVLLFRSPLDDPESTIEEGNQQALRLRTHLDLNRPAHITVPVALTASPVKLVECLHKQNVLTVPGQGMRISMLMTSWIEYWRHVKRSNRSVALGWLEQEDGGLDAKEGFAYGGKLFTPTGTRSMPTPQNQFMGFYMPKGVEQPWRDLMDVILSENRPELECIVAASFAGPLMFVPALYSGLVHFFSKGSGAHKSTAVACGEAVWGNPQYATQKIDASALGLVKNVSTIRSLPAYIDETSNTDTMEKLGKVAMQLDAGSTPSKLHQDGTMRPIFDWQTLCISAANASLWDKLNKGHNDTDAVLRRIFEVELDVVEGTMHFHGDINRKVHKLNTNYGQIGLKYAEFIGYNVKAIDAVGAREYKRFSKLVGSTGACRFWDAACAMMLFGARLANECAQVGFHVKEMEDYLVSRHLWLQKKLADTVIVGGTARSATIAMTQLLNTLQTETAWTDIFPIGRGATPAVHTYQRPKSEFKTVRVRWAVADKMLYVSKTIFDSYMHKNYGGSEAVLDPLRKNFGAFVGDYALGRGLDGLSGAQRETLVCIPVPDDTSPWWEAMHNYNQAPLDARLRAVP